MFLRQCAIIFGCLAVAEGFVHLFDINFPAPLIGMLLLTVLLKVRVIKLEWVKGFSDFLIAHMGLFFVPPGVALMLYLDIIEAQLLPIVAATVISTLLVLVSTGWVYQLIRGRK